IDAQVAREMEEEFARENQRLSEQAVRDSEIARIHAEEELKLMIEGLDRSNEVIARHLSEYEQVEADLSSKPSSKKEQRKFYMSVLKSYAGWKTKHFKGMTLEQIKEKIIPVWKQWEDFVPMSSKEESEKVKRPGIKLDQGSSKRLDPLEEVYIEALQVKHPIIDWEIHSEGKREYWKIIRLGGHKGAYQFFVDMLKQFDRDDLHQLWILVTKTFSIKQSTRDKEKKLYDTCGVHHLSTKKNQEIFMLVEKDYPLRKGLATVMINNKLQVKQYSQMASDLLLKIYNITNSPR
nr:hypothetical protein [Tanacetum cinerariifolium]